MEVKIYREKENESLVYKEEDLEIYRGLTESLGLSIPTELPKCPNIYQILNDKAKNQLVAVCPRCVDIKDYKRSTIPIEVLQVYKFAKDNEMFEGYEIWFDDAAPDPMLIGWNYTDDNSREKAYTWNRRKYLIARWGDCALEMSELCAKGFEIIKQKLIDKATEMLTMGKLIVDNPDMYTRKHLDGTLSSEYRV
jgi:hypothetical protein